MTGLSPWLLITYRDARSPRASKGGLFKTGRCCSGSCYPAKVDPYYLHHKNIMGNYGKSLKSL